MDNQNSRARIYGVALTTGGTVQDVEEWPSRVEAVTVEQVNEAARKFLQMKRSVTGVLLPERKADKRATRIKPKSGEKS